VLVGELSDGASGWSSSSRTKFGTVDEQALRRLDAADELALERYAQRILTATTLDEAFAGQAGAIAFTFSHRGRSVSVRAPAGRRSPADLLRVPAAVRADPRPEPFPAAGRGGEASEVRDPAPAARCPDLRSGRVLVAVVTGDHWESS
jgi:hypothetical protein